MFEILVGIVLILIFTAVQWRFKMNGNFSKNSPSNNDTPARPQTSLFKWTVPLNPGENASDDPPSKRQKLNDSASEIVDLTDDESYVNNVTSDDSENESSSINKENRTDANLDPVIISKNKPVQIAKVIGGISVMFPVQPYPSQIGVMSAIINGCNKSQNCLLESPTGSGKTLALLCGSLAWLKHFREGVNKDIADFCKSVDPVEYSPSKSEPTKSVSIPRIPKIFYGSRTHKQIAQVIREFKKTAYRETRMTILSSREFTCIHECPSGLSKTQLCNELRDPQKNKSCKFYTKENRRMMSTNTALQMENFETPWDIEDIVQLGEEKGCCPYFATRSLMAEAEIVFCPYNYILDPSIRDSMQLDLNGHIVIIDEGHNIEDVCRDIAGAEFRADDLGEVIHNCRSIEGCHNKEIYLDIADYLDKLAGLIRVQTLKSLDRYRQEDLSASWTGSNMWKLFEISDLGGQHYACFNAACKMAIVAYNESKENLDNDDDDNPNEKGKKEKKKKNPNNVISYNTKRFLEAFMMATTCIKSTEYADDYRCSIVETTVYNAKIEVDGAWQKFQGRMRLRNLKFMCMNPEIIFKSLAKETRTIILASGTLSPNTTFESELGIKFAYKLQANHVITDNQVYIRGIGSGPTGVQLKAVYDQVKSLSFQDELGKLLLQICKAVPHGILCFFSSYTVLSNHLERWEITGTLQEISELKEVFQEPRNSGSLNAVMNSYKEVITKTSKGPTNGVTGALLFAVFRGKVAEGIDFSDDEARCVVTVGIPYAAQADPAVKLKQEYNNLNQGKKQILSGSEWYSIQAYRALNQALGRCIRHRNDWGAILLIDHRFLSDSHSKNLPKWVKALKKPNENYDLQRELIDFVKSQGKS